MDLTKYYESICKFPILSKEEEAELFEKYTDPNTSDKEKLKIREKIINCNLRFAFKQARNFSRSNPEAFEDLITAANEGLIVGFDKFTPSSGNRFLTYAGWWVRQRILKHMSEYRIVALPIWKQQLAQRIAKFIEKEKGYGIEEEEISLEEIKINFPDIQDKYIEELYQTNYLTYFFEEVEEDFSYQHMDSIEIDIFNKNILDVVRTLGSPHSDIILEAFGFHDGKEKSNKIIADLLGFTPKEIVEMKKDAVEALKIRLRELKKEGG